MSDQVEQLTLLLETNQKALFFTSLRIFWQSFLLLTFEPFYLSSDLKSCRTDTSLKFTFAQTWVVNLRVQRWGVNIGSRKTYVVILMHSGLVQKNLVHTNALLASCEVEIKRFKFSLKEKDFIISEQKKAGRVLSFTTDEQCLFCCNYSLVFCGWHRKCISQSSMRIAVRIGEIGKR